MASKNRIVQILIDRDSMSEEEAMDTLRAAREEFEQDPPEDMQAFLEDWFGLEEDYLDDFLWW